MMFTDFEFPAEKESLIPDWTESDPEVQEQAKNWEDIVWIRTNDIVFEGTDCRKCIICDDGITANDIKQGGLGDCYFLSVLSSACESPSRIKKMFFGE
jgi:hypothetical protein